MASLFSPRFHEILANAEQEADLAEAALLIAQQLDQHIEVDDYLGKLRGMAEAVLERLPTESTMQHRIQALNHILFVEEGFRGNASDYYDPRNSYLNAVLDRRLGIPITLSIIYLSVGRRVGIPLQGVSFPGRFLVKFAWDDGEVFLDPYAGGVSLSEQQLQELLDDSFADQQALLRSQPRLLAAASRQEILMRLLRNLKAIHTHNQQDKQTLRVLDVMLSMAPDEADTVHSRAIVYDRMEYFRAALDDYQRYLRLERHAADKATIMARIAELQHWASRLH